jgi:hypothetical protein
MAPSSLAPTEEDERADSDAGSEFGDGPYATTAMAPSLPPEPELPHEADHLVRERSQSMPTLPPAVDEVLALPEDEVRHIQELHVTRVVGHRGRPRPRPRAVVVAPALVSAMVGKEASRSMIRDREGRWAPGRGVPLDVWSDESSEEDIGGVDVDAALAAYLES